MKRIRLEWTLNEEFCNEKLELKNSSYMEGHVLRCGVHDHRHRHQIHAMVETLTVDQSFFEVLQVEI